MIEIISVGLFFHIIKIILIFFMHFSNPFLTDFQLPREDRTSRLVTESQIISTLNSSIEDLLSKILKVKEDYEISTHEDHPAYSRFQTTVLTENKIVFNK